MTRGEKTVCFFVISLLAQSYIFFQFSQSCDFHAPLNLEFNWIQNFFFELRSSHPQARFETCLLPSTVLSIVFYLIIPKTRKEDHWFMV